jgi:hypothetical protein
MERKLISSKFRILQYLVRGILQRNFLYWLFLAVLLAACTKPDQAGLSFEKEFRITATRVELDPASFVNPSRVHYVDSFLLVEDSDKHRHFRAIALASRKVFFLGKVGDGPQEVTFPTSIQVLPGQRVGFFVRKKFIFGQISLRTFLNDSLPLFAFDRRVDVNHQRLVMLNDSTFVGLGIFPSRYAISDQNYQILNFQHSYPFQEDFKDINYQTLAMAYQGLLRVSPDGSRLVSAALDAGCFEIFRLEDRNLVPVKISHLTAPKFVPGEGKMIAAFMKKENQAGFLDVNVTAKSVFLLYSGKSLEQDRLANTAASTVLVYSWSGEPKYKLILDRPVTCLAVSGEDTKLYAFEYGEEPYLLEYQLPSR